jgi:hypothetical protein
MTYYDSSSYRRWGTEQVKIILLLMRYSMAEYPTASIDRLSFMQVNFDALQLIKLTMPIHFQGVDWITFELTLKKTTSKLLTPLTCHRSTYHSYITNRHLMTV